MKDGEFEQLYTVDEVYARMQELRELWETPRILWQRDFPGETAVVDTMQIDLEDRYSPTNTPHWPATLPYKTGRQRILELLAEGFIVTSVLHAPGRIGTDETMVTRVTLVRCADE